ncbi:MAG: hypothetical protein Q8R96_18120 [Bacteroidota bacterium]|nr:hypothetical protein [Bacteroidota bacterium]
MRNSAIILILGLLSVLFFSACEQENALTFNDEFKIEFNDGKTITGKDILFYDRSTHLIYLKRDLKLNPDITGFNVSVAGDTIYHGIIFSCYLSSRPPSYFIGDCFQYGNDILEIGYYGESDDLRDDPRITDAFENSNLIRDGITCEIDKIEIQSFENHSKATCTITIQNNDNINYYILDPKKMGDLDFNYFTGGLTLQNMDTKLTHPLRWSVQSGTWSTVNMDDMSLLKKGTKVTYTFQSSDYYKMEPGKYSAKFRFCGTQHCTPNINLNQKNGRVWVGQILSEINNIVIENK